MLRRDQAAHPHAASPLFIPPVLTCHLGNTRYILEFDDARISFCNCGDFFVFDLVEKRSDVSPVEYEEGQSEAIEG
ncbi:hypothetical protein ARMGADRAFT_1021104 [Armillaria gallica]|uniref:Uncharacterized protein n=1 Tax=Armillaria gallica TaxID=47427 RepID=A0A2H3CFP3_ARMGA|nr:hypothetical protein ARMGADRAFT_1021104 [Armillaria gallica]